MEARTFGLRTGQVALCAAIVFVSGTNLWSQFAEPIIVGQPGISGQPMVAGQPIVAGQRLVLPPGMSQPAYSQNGYSSNPVVPVARGQAIPGAARTIGGLSADAIPSLTPERSSSSIQRGPQGGVSKGALAQGDSAPGMSENFVVLCRDPKLTLEVSRAAEQYRRDLAIHWLGYELPPWSRRCPIHVTAGPRLGAGGETRFVLHNGNVGDWQMSMQGTPERILDSVLPHEITHTILASHFAPLNKHVPRWADEGACTTVEHDSEQGKHKQLLLEYMRTGKAMSFNRMFSLTDYPREILTLYAQGHSVSEFLIAQGGPQTFVKFLEQGMTTGQWEPAARDHYGYQTLGKLQRSWNDWIIDGRGSVEKFAGRPAASRDDVALVASNVQPAAATGAPVGSSAIAEGQSIDLASFTNVSTGNTQAEVSLIGSSAGGSDTANGYYRQRLEANLRDKSRTNAPVIR